MKLEIIKKVGEYKGAKIRTGSYGIFDKKGLLIEEYKTQSPMIASLNKKKVNKSNKLPEGVFKGK